MSISRRRFLGALSAAGGILAARQVPGLANSAGSRPGRVVLNPNSLTRFVDALPIPAPARSSGLRTSPTDPKLKFPCYRIEMCELAVRLHRDLPPTRQWGYDGSVPGPTLEARSGEGFLVEWVNALPPQHFLPIDRNIHGADCGVEVRTVAHVHGAKVPPGSDGYPEAWFGPGKSAVYHYPNEQEAATLWYHDHAMGITRLNILAGLIGLFVVRDEIEDALQLPRGEHEIPLVIYDRRLDLDGQLYYPDSGRAGAPWVPEFYGNVSLCNGRIFPYFEVEPRRYRVRIVNAANARFYNLAFSNGQAFSQIGCDLGLLPQPVELKSLLLFPAERADLIVDFSGREGERIVLRNQGEELLQFRVAQTGSKDESMLPARLKPVPRIPESQAVNTRLLTLGERDDYAGSSMVMLLDGKRWSDPISEKPALDSTEIWSLVNITGDVHPIHLHLVRFQILDRRPFDLFAYNATKTLNYTGAAVPPAANEAGWKDTVRAEPGMVTRIIIRFEAYAGRYVWHCHLLEHEDGEMMRPYEIVATTTQS